MHPRATRRIHRALASLLLACAIVISSDSVAAGRRASLADLVTYPGFETLRGALEATSFKDVLKRRQKWTLLAPSNQAFDRLAEDLGCNSTQEFLADLAAFGLLEEVLRDHLTAGRFSSQDLLMSGQVELFSGRDATVNIGAAGVLVIGDFNSPPLRAPAITAELVAGNGNALAVSGLILNVDPTGLCDYDPTATADQIITVDGNRDVSIGGADSIVVGLGRNQAIGGSETLSIGANRNQNIGVSENLSIGGDRDQNVGGSDALSIGRNRIQAIGGNDSLAIGGNRDQNVGGSETLSIAANRGQTVGGDESISISGSRTLAAGKDHTEEVGGERTQAIGTNDLLAVGKSLVIEAGDSITIKTGRASITMRKDGSIAIKGKDITVTGSGEINIKAAADLVLKGSRILQN